MVDCIVIVLGKCRITCGRTPVQATKTTLNGRMKTEAPVVKFSSAMVVKRDLPTLEVKATPSNEFDLCRRRAACP
jgi:hypothetical protein